MSEIVIFCGPTLPLSACRDVLDARYLPPAAQGDVYRVARTSPVAIGIIDGTFERTPAIWHKEILWALAHGIHVFGAASMGALRAAELCAFGMVGVGRIFEWFRDGVLEDDDEVTVAHADASLDYRSASEAMVNIRATIAAAEQSGILSAAARAELISVAKSLYYPERSYPALLKGAAEAGLSPDILQAFAGFLGEGRVNQKRLDACALLTHIRASRSALSSPKEVSFAFEHTDAWEQVVARLGRLPAEPEQSGSVETRLLLEELRLEPLSFELNARGALLRALAEEEADRSGYTVTPELRDLTQEAFRRERGLEEANAIWQWLARHHLTELQFGRFLEAETRLRWLRALYAGGDGSEFRAELVASGSFETVRSRALEKHAFLAEKGLSDPELSDAGLELPALLKWYFEVRLDRPVPGDLAAYLEKVGLSNIQEFVREAVREFLFLKLKPEEEPWRRSDPVA